ncbi:carboxypeptidase-like regulatory domain-containing protein [Mangrovimonas spongiae]|uniref:Carboxypeptidase-like regulatory domain-containing protein n=1 Tax=Mangrovimonas spongiae TaxID=2494697 RepID=A0A428K2E6_9FLAO|nr:carboxypeptidase-like regulatory domain-containing protein [Mangrovimonas spongiae]RSK40556.1 carboxypeptidase-like regulatory domain-containing protein [Mangrovimonas spongiae]
MKNSHLHTKTPYFLTFIAVIFLSTCYFFTAHAFQEQTYTEFKGTVYDVSNKDPLTFADIILEDTNISTISNTEGEFILKVPNVYLDKSLSISFLGYSKKIIALKELAKNSKVYLIPSASKLSEVTINAPKDALSLVKATLNRKGENYINEQNIMTAFYRETIKKRRRNASLAEAVVEVYKQPYKSNKRDKIKLIKARKSVDYSRLDTLALKLQGGPFSALYVDMIKYNEFIFSFDDLNNYDFTFGKSTQIDDQQVYVVNFKQKPNILDPLYYGKLYIDTDNYALVSAVFNLNVENAEKASKLFIRKKPYRVKVLPTEAAYRVDYRTHKGKWHYRYSNIQLAFKVNWKDKLFNSKYTLNSEMAITDWEENNSKFITPKERFRPSMILSEKASGFSDPNFWGEYNIIEPEKSIKSAIKKISKQLAKS